MRLLPQEQLWKMAENFAHRNRLLYIAQRTESGLLTGKEPVESFLEAFAEEVQLVQQASNVDWAP